MEAVASVVLNRAAHPHWWGHDVRSVCLALLQFSCWMPEPTGQIARLLAANTADPLFKVALAVSADAMAGRLVDRTGRANSYANLALCAPAWAKGRKPSAKIGAHTFFRVELSNDPGTPWLMVAPLASAKDALNEAVLKAVRAMG